MTDQESLISYWLANPTDLAGYNALADWHLDHGRDDMYAWLLTGSFEIGGHAGGYGYDGDDGYDGYAGGYGYDDGIKQVKGVTVVNGFYILSIRSATYPYVLVGDVEVNGLEVMVTNGRIIRRYGSSAALAQLALTGPQSDTQLLAASELEYIFRPNISRAIVANREAWE